MVQITVLMLLGSLLFSCAEKRHIERKKKRYFQPPRSYSKVILHPVKIPDYVPPIPEKVEPPKEENVKPEELSPKPKPEQSTITLPVQKRSKENTRRKKAMRVAANTIVQEGISMLKRSQLEAARDHFERVINIDPFNPEGYYYLGIVNFRRKHYRQAILFFRKVLTLYKNNRARRAMALYQTGLAYKKVGKLKKAKKYFKLSKEEDPDHSFPDPLLTGRKAVI